jgi:hypothetical protein
MGDEGERTEQDVTTLVEAVRLLETRVRTHQELPSPSSEFVMFSIARLLESIAEAAQRRELVPASVREDAERIARHILRYVDHYLPITSPTEVPPGSSPRGSSSR